LSRLDDLNRLYGILEDLRTRVGGYRYLRDCDKRTGWPDQGVYFFFEPGELRGNGTQLRVVRVGTHAVSEGSRTTLWNRLSQHRGTMGASHAGGGNHRGSIFRLHVGTALLNRDGYTEELRELWFRLHVSPEERHREYPLEKDVSDHIRAMPFLWVAVPGPASKTSDRSLIESSCVGLLSNKGKAAIDPPSSGWLGHYADRAAVRESGMWNVDFVDNEYDPSFLDVLARYVTQMGV